MIESKQVLVVGGTHGNERTGTQLLRRFQAQPHELQRKHFSAQTLLANELAYAQNRRYVDQDLNRCFSQSLLGKAPENREQARAQEINRLFGPKGADTKTDWIIDLHTTTANMGITLVVQQNDPLALDMALYVQQQLSDSIIFYEDNLPEEDPFLCSVARHGLLIEVGPVAQGLLRWQTFEQTRQALMHALDYIDLHAGGNLNLPPTREVEVFQFVEKLHLPRDKNGEIIGMVHPDLQDKDYHRLSPGDPIFILDTGDTVLFEYPEAMHVAFVNEAAYYDQAHGLSLMRKRHLSWESV